MALISAGCRRTHFYQSSSLWVPSPGRPLLAFGQFTLRTHGRGTFPSPEKYPKGRWGDPSPPFFAQSDTIRGRYPVATEILPGRWPLVIGAEVCRTSPDGPRAERLCCFLLSKTHVLPKETGNSSQKKDLSVPLTGRQPKPDKMPAADQISEGFSDSVAAQHQIRYRPIGQITGVRGLPGAFLVTFCAYKKLPGSGPGRPGKWRAASGPFGIPRVPGAEPPSESTGRGGEAPKPTPA